MDRFIFVFSHFSKKAVHYLNMYNLDFLAQEEKKARESNHVYHEEFEKIKKTETFCLLFLLTSLFNTYIKSKNNGGCYNQFPRCEKIKRKSALSDNNSYLKISTYKDS